MFIDRLGGPDGGDGGHGGDIYFEATDRAQSLLDLKFHAHWKGQRGVHGKGSDMHGKRGGETVIPVPCGTVIKDFDTEEPLADLTEPGQRFRAAKGGKGGKGNARFVTPTNRAPKFAQPGEPGEEREFFLELKLIADVGLVGFPNAGKSTLLAQVTAADPKIGDYPFTTLSPNLGVLQLSEYRTLTLADIPGVIEGAAQGKGLGHDFLRHIERTRVLLFLIDLGDPDPKDTLAKLQHELAEHSPVFQQRPAVVALNKTDITENRARLETLKPEFPDAYPVSGATGDGIQPLLEHLWTAVKAARRAEAEGANDQPEPEVEYTYEAPFDIKPIPSGYRITGRRAERAVQMTDFDNPQAVRHLQDVLKKMGLFRALKRMRAQPGQSVFIGDLEMEYQPEE